MSAYVRIPWSNSGPRIERQGTEAKIFQFAACFWQLKIKWMSNADGEGSFGAKANIDSTMQIVVLFFS